MKKFLVAGIVIFILLASLFVFRFVFGGSEDTWICESGEWVRHGNPDAKKPEEPCPVYGQTESLNCPEGEVAKQCKRGPCCCPEGALCD